MSTLHHSALPFGGPLTAAAMEAPLAQLDAAIAAIIIAGSAVSTTLASTASSGTTGPFTVASTAGLVAGDLIYFGSGALFEPRIVNTVPTSTTFTTTAALTNTYTAGKPVSKSPVELVDARGGSLTLGARLTAIDAAIAGSSSAAAEVIAARNAFGSLDARLDAADAAEAARDAALIGEIKMWGAVAAPTGFVLCNGASLLRAGTYAGLFAIIGTTYGSVDSSHFTVPDLRGRFPLGQAASGTGATLGGTGGAIDHAHTGAAHVHEVIRTGQFTDSASTTSGGTGFTAGGVAHRHITADIDVMSESTTPGVGGNANPPFLAVNFIIRYA